MSSISYVPDPERYDGRMPYRRTGRSGLQLPMVSLGFWHNFGDDKPLETQRAIMRRAFDLGITTSTSRTTTVRPRAPLRSMSAASCARTSPAFVTNW